MGQCWSRHVCLVIVSVLILLSDIKTFYLERQLGSQGIGGPVSSQETVVSILGCYLILIDNCLHLKGGLSSEVLLFLESKVTTGIDQGLQTFRHLGFGTGHLKKVTMSYCSYYYNLWLQPEGDAKGEV